MNKKKIVLFAFFVFISLLADNSVAPSPEYSSVDTYTNPSLDWSKIDYTKVDWGLIESQNLFSKVDLQKYVGDFCKSCSFDSANSDKSLFEFSSQGMRYGKSFVSPLSYSNVIFYVTKEGSIAVRPKEAKLEIPNDNKLEVESGKDVTVSVVPVSFEMQGSVNVDSSKTSVREGETAIINGIKITPRSGDVRVFYNGEKPEGTNYVSFDSQNSVAFSTGQNGEFEVIFERSNTKSPIKIEDGDSVKLYVGPNTAISIENREKTGEIPLVTATQKGSNSYFEINSGLTSVKLENSKVLFDINQLDLRWNGKPQSSPMTVVIKDKEGNSLLYDRNTGTARKIIVSNYNEIGVVELGSKEGMSLFNSISGKISESLKFNYEDFRDLSKIFPAIKINPKSEKLDSSRVKRMSDLLGALTPEMRSGVKEIIILKNDDFERISPEGGKGSVAWTMEDRVLRLRFESLLGSLNEEATPHEIAHTYNFLIEEKEKSLARSKKDYQSFEKKWNAAAGENKLGADTDNPGAVYGNDMGPLRDSEGRVSRTWADGGSNPRYGCLDPHSCANYYEDVATITARIHMFSPDYFRKYYLNGDPEHSERITNKLKILKEYKFITNEQYCRIAGCS